MTDHYKTMASCAYGIRDGGSSVISQWKRYNANYKGNVPCSTVRCMNEMFHSAVKVKDSCDRLIPEAEMEYAAVLERIIGGVKRAVEVPVTRGALDIDLGDFVFRKTKDAFMVKMPKIGAHVRVMGLYMDKMADCSFLVIQCPSFEIRYYMGRPDDKFVLPEEYCDDEQKGMRHILPGAAERIVRECVQIGEIDSKLKDNAITREQYFEQFGSISTDNGFQPSPVGHWMMHICDSVSFCIDDSGTWLNVHGEDMDSEVPVNSVSLVGIYAVFDIGGDTFITFSTEGSE